MAVGLAGASITGVASARSQRFACGKANGRGLLLISPRTGRISCDFPNVEFVRAAASDGRGGWFIAGDFSGIGRRHVAGVAHLLADGHVDGGWSGQTPAGLGYVGYHAIAIVRESGGVYVAGPRWVERLDASSGAIRWLVRVHSPNGGAAGLAVDGRHVFFGAPFTRVRHVKRHGLVALDPKDGTVQSWRARRVGVGDIGGLALYGSSLYVGGDRGVVALTASDGRTVRWRSRASSGLVLLATRQFVFTYNPATRAAVTLSARSGRLVRTFGPRNLSSVAVSGSVLYGWGGDAATPGPWQIQNAERRSVAAVDLKSDRVTTWDPVIGTTYVYVQAIAADPHAVLVAGSFTASLG